MVGKRDFLSLPPSSVLLLKFCSLKQLCYYFSAAWSEWVPLFYISFIVISLFFSPCFCLSSTYEDRKTDEQQRVRGREREADHYTDRQSLSVTSLFRFVITTKIQCTHMHTCEFLSMCAACVIMLSETDKRTEKRKWYSSNEEKG